MKKDRRGKHAAGLSPDEAAARWFTRRRVSDGLGADEAAAFEAWLAAAEENRAAYRRAEDRWNIFEDCRGDRTIKALRQAALDAAPARPRWVPYGIAAGLAALVVAASVLLMGERNVGGSGATADAGAFGVPDYATGKGERLHGNLPDGTIITLNTASAIDVAFAEERREVRLLSGEAYFEVARDADRPFIVEAGGRRITALGTAFNVRLDGDFQLTLVEGKVAVDGDVTVQARAAADASRTPMPSRLVLTPGQKLVAAAEGTRLVEGAPVARELRWRDGFIEFEAEPLANAVAEFNRYALTPIVVEDARVAELRISGVFRTARPDGFVQVAEEILPVAAEHSGGKVTLLWAGGTL